MNDLENKIKILSIIQEIINRMNDNSMKVRSYTITLLVALMGAKEIFSGMFGGFSFIFISLLMIISFGLLEHYYLGIEKKWREVYDSIASQQYQGNYLDISSIYKEKTFKHSFSFVVHGFYFVLFIGVLIYWIICVSLTTNFLLRVIGYV